MKILTGPVVVLDGADCAALGHQLADAIRLGWTVRGAAPPQALLTFADQVNACLRVPAQPGTGRETGRFPAGPVPSSSDQTVWLTATEAARIGNLSVQFTRECLRRGDLRGSRGHRGAWRVDAAEVAAWVGRRRKEHNSKAA